MSGARPVANEAGIDSPFWAGLSAGELRIQRCAGCEQWSWPPQWRCGSCGSWEMRWDPVAMEGVIHALTWTRHPFSPATVGKTPYPLLLVELPHAGGARLLGLLRSSGQTPAIGAAVYGAIEPEAGRGLPALRWQLTHSEA